MRVIWLALILVLMVGCESMPISFMKPAIDESGARGLFDEGKFREAADAYDKLARYDRKLRAHYQLQSALAWREEGELGNAKLALKGVKRKLLGSDDAFMLDLLDAEFFIEEGNFDGALSLLVADTKNLKPDLAARYLELRARAFEAKHSYVDAAHERASLMRYLDAVEKTANEHDLKDLLAKLSPDERRNALRATDRTDPLYDFLVRSGGAREASTGSFTQSVSQAQAATRTTEFGQLARDPIKKIALLLPASGPFAPAAKAVQDGVMAGYFADVGVRPDVILIDSGSTPASAKAAYQRAMEAGADMVIGPLQRDQVTAVFQDSGANVPTLALNFAELPVLPPKGSLQFALLPEEEAVAAANYMWEHGLKHVSMLSSSDDFGKRAADGFAARFQALGGTIVGAASYPASGNNYSDAVRKAVGVGESMERIAMVRSIVGIPFSAEPTRRYDHEGLFLAARPQQGRSLVPQIRVFDADEWPIVATSHVYGAMSAASLDNDLNGVVFCEVPWVLGTTDATIPKRSQVSSLPSSIGSGGRLFAFGIDAYRLAPYLSALENSPGVAVPGATGQLSADQNGSIRRKPSWATMVGGGARAN
jgi:uncharacterized protein